MVQFRVSRLFGLHVDVDGILIPDQIGLKLVFHRPDADETLLDAKVESIEIPWEDVESWDVDYGLLSDQISLKVTAAARLQALPGVKERSVDLTIHKQQRAALKEFEQRAREYQIGRRIDEVDEMIDDIRDFLDDI